jgi:DNA-directed RNA polymerase specialized sigma24 family protein
MQFHCDVDALPDLQRLIFRRIWYDEATKSEIATELGISIRTVQRNYRLACETLMSTLSGFC